MRLLAAALPVFLAAARAVAGEADPIDAALQKCLEAAPAGSTADLRMCLSSADHAWELALSDAYGDLMRSLNPAQRDALQAAQRQWQASHDAERNFMAALLVPGTPAAPQITLQKSWTNLARERVLLLRTYRDIKR